jgi:murein DD-endopeptidase MepM/ murein hydrolase activator NlpD
MTTLFKRQFFGAVGASCVAAFSLAAMPALANTSANAAATDVIQPIEEAQGEGITSSSPEFLEYFNQWTEYEKVDPKQAVDFNITRDANRPGIAIPSGMPLRNATLTSGYGMRSHPVLRKRASHKGVDLAAPTGTPIYATADGVVSRANWFSSYGLFISVEHSGDLQTRYAHLSRLAVAEGERVRKGDLIGYVGSTGRSTGPHLHYEVRMNGVAVNPIPYMNESRTQTVYSGDNRLTAQGGD